MRAKVLAREGKHAEAEPLSREAIRLAESTDMVNRQGHARADLAEVLTEAGRKEQAAAELDVALAHYERKGNLVAAANAVARGLEEAREAAHAGAADADQMDRRHRRPLKQRLLWSWSSRRGSSSSG